MICSSYMFSIRFGIGPVNSLNINTSEMLEMESIGATRESKWHKKRFFLASYSLTLLIYNNGENISERSCRWCQMIAIEFRVTTKIWTGDSWRHVCGTMGLPVKSAIVADIRYRWCANQLKNCEPLQCKMLIYSTAYHVGILWLRKMRLFRAVGLIFN